MGTYVFFIIFLIELGANKVGGWKKLLESKHNGSAILKFTDKTHMMRKVNFKSSKWLYPSVILHLESIAQEQTQTG
ncbi:hypothetical protein BDA99DRAFT_510705 [Phascolomyces articulosus]|uniref:Uncharacterized protein n=1 Tax=Phascolomyces articulosus TaxID=60185 RepID=A0AAD5JZJ7_9FUNG|nr:hypothetical protein BDA99DRAFT_510705 [Phascolomyces articulosus]